MVQTVLDRRTATDRELANALLKDEDSARDNHVLTMYLNRCLLGRTGQRQTSQVLDGAPHLGSFQSTKAAAETIAGRLPAFSACQPHLPRL